MEDKRISKEDTQPRVVVVKLNKYKSLVDALGDGKTTLRMVFTLFLLCVLLFIGITIITLAVKRLYPYSDITTNGLGATTIKSEKNEVSYWLFNTAILWADSGITVKQGDILTIRASGKSNTAIHHLNDAAKFNTKRIDAWVGSEGELDSTDSFNYSRRQFRIFPNLPSGALLMQVVENGKVPFDTPRDDRVDDKANEDNFYFIGKERQNIYINYSGTLHFAVNDIVLNRRTIANLMREFLGQKQINGADEKLDSATYSVFYKAIKDTLDVRRKSLNQSMLNTEQQDSILYSPVGKMKFGWAKMKDGEKVCELSYYFGEPKSDVQEEALKTVWFDDNVGSFLIVIEKQR